jgi:hypothetical protein
MAITWSISTVRYIVELLSSVKNYRTRSSCTASNKGTGLNLPTLYTSGADRVRSMVDFRLDILDFNPLHLLRTLQRFHQTTHLLVVHAERESSDERDDFDIMCTISGELLSINGRSCCKRVYHARFRQILSLLSISPCPPSQALELSSKIVDAYDES